MNCRNRNRVSFLRNFRSPVIVAPCSWSGSGGALLRRRPLRTGRADHPASGSSHSSAPWCGTGQPDGAFRNSTGGEVSGPLRIKRIGQPPDLDVSHNRDRHCAEESAPAGTGICRTLRNKVPGPVSVDPEVPVSHPPCSFRGMTSTCPLPEHFPDVRIYRREACFRHDVTVIHSPSPNDWVQFLYQRLLRDARVAFDDLPDLVEECFNTLPCRLDQ